MPIVNWMRADGAYGVRLHTIADTSYAHGGVLAHSQTLTRTRAHPHTHTHARTNTHAHAHAHARMHTRAFQERHFGTILAENRAWIICVSCFLVVCGHATYV